MEQKDPKDMTASELVRWAANYADITCRACRKMGFGCDSGEVCFCEQVWDHIADKIDAELAEARNESLLQGAQVWAKANGWPDFREGEDFGAWLDRCTLPRPRFEDGEVVGVREYEDIQGYCVYDDGEFFITTPNRSIDYAAGERVERPAPEVLGADGLPLKVGEVVYSAWYGHRNPPITSVHKAGDTIDGFPSELDFVRYEDGYDWAKDLTHTPPDTQWRIDRDVHKDECEYFDHVGNCRGCPANGTCESCIEAMTLDLLRRQRELDKRMGGE